MRSFFQKKAGATYLKGFNLTIAIRKNEIEYIFALEGGWHAVINMIFDRDMILLFANLGKFSHEMDKVLGKVSFKDGEMPKLTGMLSGKSIYTFMEVDTDGKGLTTGVGRRLPVQEKHPLEIIGDPNIHKEAGDLVNHLLKFYHELRESDKTLLRSLADSFYD